MSLAAATDFGSGIPLRRRSTHDVPKSALDRSVGVSTVEEHCMYLIVTGIPASGKSTIARALAEKLELEIWDKDDILEDLFNKKGIGDSHWRTLLSRTADGILQARARQSESSVIVSW